MSIDVSFTDASSAGQSGPITAWAWDFGDSGTSASQNPVHTYAAAGRYTVQLTVTGTSPDGTNMISRPVNVGVSDITASFTSVVDGGNPLLIHFTDTSSPGPSGPITAWAWDFGDGGSSASQNPTHTYAATGTYTVILTVTGTSPDGTDANSQPIDVQGGGVVTTYQPYINTSTFNKKIPVSPPIHPDTGLMISNANNWTGTGFTWLGPRQRPTYYRGDTSMLGTVTMYANGNGWVGAGPFTMPMPSWASAVIGPTCEKGDSNLVIVDSVTGAVWELAHVTPPGYAPRNSGFPSGRWNCGAYRHWTADTTTKKGYGPPSTSNVPSTSASQIHISCGLLVPEDFADCFSGSDPGTVIPHALRTSSFCGSDGTAHPKLVAPAFGGDGRQAKGIPCGGRIQLDPSINVSAWASVTALREPWRSGMRKMLRTMQQYGIVQVDSTFGVGAGSIDCAGFGSVVKGGTTYPVGFKFPNEVAGYGWGYGNGVPDDLMSHFRVIDWTKWTGA